MTFSEGFDGLASFSTDGKTLTWSHRNEKGESQIYLSDWNDHEARRLLKLPAVDSGFDFKLSEEIKIDERNWEQSGWVNSNKGIEIAIENKKGFKEVQRHKKRCTEYLVINSWEETCWSGWDNGSWYMMNPYISYR